MENLIQDGKCLLSKESHCQSQEDRVGQAMIMESGLGLLLLQTQHLGSRELITGKIKQPVSHTHMLRFYGWLMEERELAQNLLRKRKIFQSQKSWW